MRSQTRRRAQTGTRNVVNDRFRKRFRDLLTGPGRSRTRLSVKQIFRNAARREETTESVLESPKSHATLGLVDKCFRRRFLSRVDSGS